jgi:hypothetical protein
LNVLALLSQLGSFRPCGPDWSRKWRLSAQPWRNRLPRLPIRCLRSRPGFHWGWCRAESAPSGVVTVRTKPRRQLPSSTAYVSPPWMAVLLYPASDCADLRHQKLRGPWHLGQEETSGHVPLPILRATQCHSRPASNQPSLFSRPGRQLHSTSSRMLRPCEDNRGQVEKGRVMRRFPSSRRCQPDAREIDNTVTADWRGYEELSRFLGTSQTAAGSGDHRARALLVVPADGSPDRARMAFPRGSSSAMATSSPLSAGDEIGCTCTAWRWNRDARRWVIDRRQ